MEINRDDALVETQKELQGFYAERTALLEEIEDLEREVYRAGDSEKARIEQQVKKLTKDAEKLTENIGENEDKLMAASPMWESKKSITDAMSHLNEEQQLELSEKVQEHVDKAVDALAAAGSLPPWAIEKSRAAREGVDTSNFEKLSKAQSQVKDEEAKIKALEENLAEADED